MNDRDYLKLAIDQARKSVDASGFPAGAIIVKDGKIVAEGISIGFRINDPSGHAETAATRAACQKLNTYSLKGATLYESLECCNMCFSVAYWAGISKIVYACRKTPEMVSKLYYEGSTKNGDINESNNRKIEWVFLPDFEADSLTIIKNWEEKQKLTI